MCIVFLAWKYDHKWPVLVGANREESTKRPIGNPIVKEVDKDSYKYMIAGEDFGPNAEFSVPGTWMGMNQYGFFVAVTNRDDGLLKGADQVESRGILCHKMLKCPSVLTATELCIRELRNGGYGGCNFIMADALEGIVVHAPHKDAVKWEKLRPGIHCITNLDMDDPGDERVLFVRRKMSQDLVVHGFVNLAKKICSSPEIIKNDPNHGTIASSVLACGIEETLFYHCVGKPNEKAYDDMSHMTEKFVAT